jgi:hypothetical protein
LRKIGIGDMSEIVDDETDMDESEVVGELKQEGVSFGEPMRINVLCRSSSSIINGRAH